MARKQRVGIIGGGIGGVALAACLLRSGFEVKMFERAAGFGEVGAGIQMTPNAVKVMRALGLLDKLLAVGFLPNALVGRNWRTGRENFRTPLKDAAVKAYGAPFIHIHRADLHAILASLVPGEVPTFGVSCTGVRQDERCATARFADGTTYEADVIIGADGVRSVVRAELFGDEAAKFTGHMCYRAIVPVPGVVDFASPDGAFWLGPHGHVVTYYVQSGKAVNIVAVTETDKWVEENWNARSSREEMLGAFKGWHRNVETLFARVDEVYKWGLFDRDPMETWSRGRITLLGDAAHPMLPFLSQGAAMAIEDAWVLAASLDGHGDDVAAAFGDYEAERLPRTSRVQLQARERGRTYHLPSPFAQAKRDFVYWVRGIINPQTTGLGANWVYDYDATSFRPTVISAVAGDRRVA
jgi:salicylate hydroxylase